jgi:hypothetical protein
MYLIRASRLYRMATKSLCSHITAYLIAALHSPHTVWSISILFQTFSSTLKAEHRKSSPWWLLLDPEDLLAAVWESLLFKCPRVNYRILSSLGFAVSTSYQTLVQSIVHWMCHCDILDLGITMCRRTVLLQGACWFKTSFTQFWNETRLNHVQICRVIGTAVKKVWAN